MISKLKEQNTQIVIAIIAIFVVVSLTYFGFRAPYHHYLPMIHLAQNPGDFGLDPVLSNSVFLKASIYYDLITLANIPITNDLLGLMLHNALNGLMLYLLWKITRTVLGVKNSVSAILLVLSSCFLYSKFVLGVAAMPITYVTLTPTGLAHLAGMFALLLLLQRQYLAAFILATLCVGLNPKGNILIVPGLVFYLLIDRSIPRRAILWATLPIGYVLWRAIDTTTESSIEDASRMIINIMRREQEDGFFSEQPVLMQLAFVATVLSWPLLAKQITNLSLRKLGWAFHLTTSGAVLFNIIYEPNATPHHERG
jgi:hypothetical protein